MTRVAAYIDGYNLYHAVDALRDNRLKWLDLSALVRCFIDPSQHRIAKITYFSALAHWKKDAVKRHEEYIKALKHIGINIVMGKFKNKDRSCNSCGATWGGHEEKETDVNIALHLLNDAYLDVFDQALIISQDSDLFPAISMVRRHFPHKKIKIITPPNLKHSKEMARIVDDKNLGSIKQIHVERSQLPNILYDRKGQIVSERPAKYRSK